MSDWKGQIDHTLKSSQRATVLLAPAGKDHMHVTTIDDAGHATRHRIPNSAMGDLMGQVSAHMQRSSGSIVMAAAAETGPGTYGPGHGPPVGPHGRPTWIPSLTIALHTHAIHLADLANAHTEER